MYTVHVNSLQFFRVSISQIQISEVWRVLICSQRIALEEYQQQQFSVYQLVRKKIFL